MFVCLFVFQGCHCILEGIPPTICKERLGILQLYPIIIFIKFKSAKQIREQKDPFFLPERLTNRQAKDLFEYSNKMEQEYKPHFDGELPMLLFICFLHAKCDKTVHIHDIVHRDVDAPIAQASKTNVAKMMHIY